MTRITDIVFSISLLILLLIPLSILFIFKTQIFKQTRIGQHGKPFTIYKLKTMEHGRVTRMGKWLRKYKVDELPQLWNVIKGDMSIVGPRPDVPGYYDKLVGNDRKVLQLKPGLTSLAAIKYRNEEQLLAQQEDPPKFNDEVLFPDKVKMNLEYLEKRSFTYDVHIILKTIQVIFK